MIEMDQRTKDIMAILLPLMAVLLIAIISIQQKRKIQLMKQLLIPAEN